jgi:hypothetical protein
MKKFRLRFFATLLNLVVCLSIKKAQPSSNPELWQVYQQSLKEAKYVGLTHTITPAILVWSGFGSSKFKSK